jgi:hypothetical protein
METVLIRLLLACAQSHRSGGAGRRGPHNDTVSVEKHPLSSERGRQLQPVDQVSFALGHQRLHVRVAGHPGRRGGAPRTHVRLTRRSWERARAHGQADGRAADVSNSAVHERS